MTRLDRYFLPTEREAPADAEALSHKLGVRAGLIRQVGAGLWSWLPAGWRVHENVAQIVREEIDRIGGQEMLMPVITPAELWKRSGRYAIDEVFKLKDRRSAEFVLALSHEETVTLHVAQTVRSYRQLPMLLYHFQTKGRDEPRPRAGVLRTREFIMKDAYSFDRDEEGLDASYAEVRRGLRSHLRSRRPGVVPRRVRRRDDGRLGRARVHGAVPGGRERRRAGARLRGQHSRSRAPMRSRWRRSTSRATCTRRGRRRSPPWPTPLGVQAGNAAEGLSGGHRVARAGHGLRARRPPRQRDQARQRPGRELPPGDATTSCRAPGGFLGPTPDVAALYDDAIVLGQAYLTGANRPDYHRVVTVDGGERGDFRTVEAGDTVNGHPIRIEPAIEIANIFKLGTRYSEPLGATYLDENGKEQLIVMGCYGIGPARITAAAIEQYADEKGISWPKAIAPWDVEIVAIGKPGTPERDAAEALYSELSDAGLKVLLDDRDAGPGEKFADAELLGVPLRLTVGKRSLDSGRAEAQARRGRADHEGGVPLQGAAEAVRELWTSLP